MALLYLMSLASYITLDAPVLLQVIAQNRNTVAIFTSLFPRDSSSD
jgi:hypothetical protein